MIKSESSDALSKTSISSIPALNASGPFRAKMGEVRETNPANEFLRQRERNFRCEFRVMTG